MRRAGYPRPPWRLWAAFLAGLATGYAALVGIWLSQG